MRRRFWLALFRFAAKRGGFYDWVEDATLTAEELREYMADLPEVELRGTPRVVLKSTWPLNATSITSGNTSNITWTYK